MDNQNFYSIDRLVEFGMGMAMAQQMVKMMNETMQTMYVPGSPQTIPAPQPLSNIHVAIDGKDVGPLTEQEFASLVTQKKISKESLVWTPGMLSWKPLQEVPSILKIVALAPPPLPNL
ncbi:MAG: DUF4339 domain-containing protein [Bacteroidales bacterium]|nr:DUF4339 domain-containing protein [Bacteroidales bacterium]